MMPKTISQTTATRDAKALAIALRKAAAAIEKAGAAAAALQPDAGTAKARVIRHSRDLTVQIGAAEAAVKSAKKIAARVTWHSRDLVVEKRATRHSRDL